MPLRRNDSSITEIYDRFWERECKGVLASFPSNEKHWPLSEDDVMKQLSAFAEKYSEKKVFVGKIDIDDKKDKIVLAITCDEWMNDRIVFTIATKNACGIFYVTGRADNTNHLFPDNPPYTFNCNIEQTLKNLEAFIKKFPKKREQIMNRQNARDKENKLLDMAEKSIETIVPQMMASTNYEWNLFCAETRYLLSIKMKKHKMIQIALTPKNFANKIPRILSTISQIENLLKEISFSVDIKSYGSNIKWRKGSGKVK